MTTKLLINYALDSRSISKRVCDSLKAFCFFAWTVASVRNRVDEIMHITAPTTPTPNDQPATQKVIVIIFTGSKKYSKYYNSYQRNCWHAPASICLCFQSTQKLWQQFLLIYQPQVVSSQWSIKNFSALSCCLVQANLYIYLDEQHKMFLIWTGT